jgi:hypothetical protein
MAWHSFVTDRNKRKERERNFEENWRKTRDEDE